MDRPASALRGAETHVGGMEGRESGESGRAIKHTRADPFVLSSFSSFYTLLIVGPAENIFLVSRVPEREHMTIIAAGE
jgi:hypothetical protein